MSVIEIMAQFLNNCNVYDSNKSFITMKSSRIPFLKAFPSYSLILFFAFQCHSSAKDIKGYGLATNSAFSENIFIKNWLILGPIPIEGHQKDNVDDSDIQKALDEDLITAVKVDNNSAIDPLIIGKEKYSWKFYHSANDIIRLNELLGNKNNSVSYALSEIIVPDDRTALIGLGSDDDVKVWINGKEVHKNKVARAVSIDNDIFEITLNKGSNQVLIKIVNGLYDYGFSFRPLGKDLISKLTIQCAGDGNFDQLTTLMKYSPDLKSVNSYGLNAWQMATVRGRNEIAQYLEKNRAVRDSIFPSLSEVINNALSPFNNTDSVSGIALLIAKDGKIIYKNGFGFANLYTKTRVTTETKFRIGSVSKQFTAAAILRLQEQGKINVNDKLSMYLPDFPRGNEITIHHLLTHTSGIHSYTDRNDFIEKLDKPIDEADLIKKIESDTFEFNPGDQFKYCNSGYYILGYIVSKVSGKSLSEYLNDEFFKPLGMKNTGTYDNRKRPDHEAIGYQYNNNKILPSSDWDMTWAGGAGALYSTVEDLYLWNEALFNSKVLNQNSLKMAFTPVVLNNGKQAEPMIYGYGWMLPEFRGVKYIAHGGGLDGFLSFLMRQPDEKITIVVLTNATPPYMDFEPQGLSFRISEYMLWPKMNPQSVFITDTTMTAEHMKVYTGKYDYGMGMILTVTADGNHLMAQMSGQQSFEIYYMGNDEFYWKVVEARIRFLKDEKGIINGATHFQGGLQLNVKKL